MVTNTIWGRLIVVLVLIGLLLGPVHRTEAIFQTIGDFLSLGANTVREVQEAIQLAGSEVRSILQQLEGTLLDLLGELEDTYQDNLNITLDSLDATTRNKLLEVESIMLTVNEMIQEDISLIGDEARDIIQTATLEIRRLTDDIKRDLQDVVLVAGETGVFLIERTTENIIVIASIVLLAIGLLLFVFILMRGGIRSAGFATILGYVFIFAYLIFFGAMLVPQVRALVMATTGIGLRERLETITDQPDIFAVIPNTIRIGETDEIDIWGSQLTPNGEEPTVTIANRSVTVGAMSSDRIVLDVSRVVAAAAQAEADPVEALAAATKLLIGRDLASDLELAPALPVDKTIRIEEPIDSRLRNVFDLIRINPDLFGPGVELPEGSATLKLEYENFEDITTVVTVIEPTPIPTPADLRISRFVVTPSALVENQNARASITVRNDGETEARNFMVRWKPTATHPGLSANVSRLMPGASQIFTFNHAYVNQGTFDTVATVDVLNRVAESNEGNNDSQVRVAVAEEPPRQARVTVRFTGVTVHDDADPWPKGAGEIWFSFSVNSASGRYPNSGSVKIGSGSTKSFTRTFPVTIAEGDTLHVFVNGREGDDDSGDDSMGTVNATYRSSQNWGTGSHSDRSTCPDGCYTIHYTISMQWLS